MIRPAYSEKLPPPCLCLFFWNSPSLSIHAQAGASFNYQPLHAVLCKHSLRRSSHEMQDVKNAQSACHGVASQAKVWNAISQLKPFSPLCKSTVSLYISYFSEKVLDSRPVKYIFNTVSDDLMPSINDNFDLRYVEPTCMWGATSLTSLERLSCSGMVLLNSTDSCTWNSMNFIYEHQWYHS